MATPARRTGIVAGLLTFVSSTAAAQQPEFHYLHGGKPHGIAFAEKDGGGTQGIVVADGGRIRYSEDDGTTWEPGRITDADYRQDLRGVFMLNDEDAWAVGDGGAVLRSTNGGETWSWVNQSNPIYNLNNPAEGAPTPAELYAIWMFDTEKGWVVGNDGVLRFTNSGGATWLPGDPNGTAPTIFSIGQGAQIDFDDVYDIEFADAQHGIAPADWSRYYWTKDGGETWNLGTVGHLTSDGYNAPLGQDWYLELWSAAYSREDPSQAWMAGGVSHNGGHLFHSTDYGQTWSRVNHFDASSPVGLPYDPDWQLEGCALNTFYGVARFDTATESGDTLTVGYGAGVFRYEPGSAQVPVDVREYDPEKASCSSQELPACCDNDPENCGAGKCVCGVCGEIQTDWTGAHWVKTHPLPGAYAPYYEPRMPLNAVFALDEDRGWLCGRAGVIQATDDAGATWDDQGSVEPVRWYGGDFRSSEIGCLIGQGGITYLTEDGGETFDLVHPPLAQIPYLFGATDPSQSLVRGVDLDLQDLVGVSVDTDGHVAVTDDGGQTWSWASTDGQGLPTSPLPGQFSSLNGVHLVPSAFSVPPPHAWIVGSGGYVAKSTDGGQQWNQVSLPSGFEGMNVRDAAFVDASKGYLVGDAGLALYTDNGGASWSQVLLRNASATPQFRSVATWGDASHAVAVTADWEVYQRDTTTGKFAKVNISGVLPEHDPLKPGFTDVRVVGGGATWVVCGYQGIVLMRQNGVWSAPKTYTTEPLVAVPFQSASQGFVVGFEFLLCEWR